MVPSYNTGNCVRLRIAEIELQPFVLKRAVKAEVLIDGKAVSVLPTIEGGQPLKWSNLIICDTNSASRIEIVVYSRQLRIYSRYGSESCLVSEIMESSTKTLRIKIDYSWCHAKIKVLDKARTEELFSKRRQKLAKMEQTNYTPDHEGLKATQRMFKAMLEFGSAVAEFNPIAETVFAVCTYVWERVEEQHKLGEELADLTRKLVGMAPLVEEVKKYARLEPLQQNIEEFLHLIEDVSIFVLEYKTKGFVVQAFRSMFDSSDRDRAEELGKRFQKTKGEFDAAIGVQTMVMVATAGERELLKQLNPVEPSGYDPSRICQAGTRLRVLGDIDDWIQDPDPSSTFMWIYGQAGIGKSTISASLCSKLRSRGTPIISFFCKRDDPALRDPLRLINSIAHGLACRYTPYGKLVAKAIEANPELCTSHLGVRYEGLLKEPLCELKFMPCPPPHFVLVDAVDESGVDGTQRELLGYLRELSLLVPWVRIIVTSRPENNIRSFFDQHALTPVSRCDLQTYPATNDIRVYVEAMFTSLATEDGWPAGSIDRLCAKAGELFIWAVTACKFILNADDSRGRLLQLVDGSGSGGGFNGLDSLYRAIIQNSMADRAEDSVLNIRRCIGAIMTVSMRQPVPIEVLCELMRVHVEPGVLRKVVGRLGAVLYSDMQLEGAIRVLHPSFADFALNEHRSGDFWINPVQRNIELSIGCITTLEHELKFNICEFETSHRLNTEVPDLESKIQANISGQLAYSCIFWISHLIETNDNTLAGQVTNIVEGPRLLFWLEVLSVLQRVDVAVQGLRELGQWLPPNLKDISQYIWDAYRFVFAFTDPIISSAPHIYVSALALTPMQSEISCKLKPWFPKLAIPLDGADTVWPGWLRSIPQPAKARSLCISRHNQRLVTSCCEYLENDPAQISMFDLRTGAPLRSFSHSSTDHQSLFIAISPDGTLVVSGSWVGEVLFWDANTGDIIHTIRNFQSEHESLLFCAWAFLDGFTFRLLVVRETDFKEVIELWTIRPGERETNIIQLPQEDTAPIVAVALSPDGARIGVGYDDGRVAVTPWFDLTPTTLFIAQYPPRIIVFSPDGTLIAVASTDSNKGALQMWNTRKSNFQGKPIWSNRRILSIAFSSDGARVITSANDYTVRIWNTEGDAIGPLLFKHPSPATSITFSPDDAYVLSGSNEDTTVRMWDASRRTSVDRKNRIHAPEHKYVGHSSQVGTVTFSPDGSRIISGSNDSTVRTWNSQTGVPVGEPLSVDSGVIYIALSPNGTRMVATTEKKTLYVWDDIRKSTRTSSHDGISSFALSPDGNHLVAGIDDQNTPPSRMALWDVKTNKKIKDIFGETRSHPDFIAYSSDGSRMFTHHHTINDESVNAQVTGPNSFKSEDRVYIWDTSTYSVIRSWDVNICDRDQSDSLRLNNPEGQVRVHMHSISPNGALLAASYGNKVLVYNAHTGILIVEGCSRHKKAVNCIVFSPDGNRMASGSKDGTIRVFSVGSDTAAERLLFKGRPAVLSVAFSPDGTKLAAGFEDSSIRVWNVSVNGRFGPWRNGNVSHWPSNTLCFPPHPTRSGWVSHDQQSLTLWLPDHYRRKHEPDVLLCIANEPMVHINFSKFVHGTAWTSIISEETLGRWSRPTRT